MFKHKPNWSLDFALGTLLLYSFFAYHQGSPEWFFPLSQWEPEVLFLFATITFVFMVPFIMLCVLFPWVRLLGLLAVAFVLTGCSTPKYPSIYGEKSFNQDFPTEQGILLHIDQSAVSRFTSIESEVLTVQVDMSHVETYNTPRVISVVQPKEDRLKFHVGQRVFIIYGKGQITVLPI